MAKSNSDVATRQRHDHWQELLGRWQASGLSQAAFCRRERIPVWQLAWWKKRLKGRGGVPAATFVPVRLDVRGLRPNRLELVLGGRRRLRFAAEIDPAKLAGIVAALEALGVEPRPC